MPGPDDLTAVRVTLALAATTTVILLLLGTPLAWWLSHTRSRTKPLIGAIVALPIVLPPTVLGFYLLLLLGPHGPVGRAMQALGLHPLPFTVPGLVVASVCYSLPFVVQPLQSAFEGLGRGVLEAAATLRAGPFDRFVHIVIPLAAPGFVSAAVLAFAHTVGEFGIVLMIGGNIPGQTQTLAVSIYNHVESLDYARAHELAGGMVVFALLVLWIVQSRGRQFLGAGAVRT